MNVRDALLSVVPVVAMRDAELLLADSLGKERAWLRAHPEAEVDGATEQAFRERVQRRAAGVPLQYVLGAQEFFGLTLQVTPAVLIPRPETEHLVEAVLAWAAGKPGSLRIVDVGTGSGAIAVALASRLPDAEITGVDLSEAALSVARENADRLGLGSRVHLQRGDLLGGFAAASFDAVVSNPPYVPSGDAATMQREVVDHEPHSALFAGADGLNVYRRLVPEAWSVLRSGGLLAMEFGFGQREALEQLLGVWDDVKFMNDYAGIPRVVLATRP